MRKYIGIDEEPILFPPAYECGKVIKEQDRRLD